MSNAAGNLYWKDKDGHYLGCNNAFAKIAGLSSPKEINGKTNKDLFSNHLTTEEIDKLHQIDELVIKNGDEITTEEYGINEKKQKAFYLSKKIPLKNNSGQIIGMIGTSIDISKQKEADQLKKEFISNMMHDIRTPFVGVLGMAELLWNKENDPEKKEYLSILMESTTKLLDYNNEILDFNKYEMSDFKQSKTTFNCKALIDEIMQMNQSAANFKNIALSATINFPYEMNELIGDATSYKRILINLLGNAIKFTKSGYVKLRVTLEKNKDEFFLIKFVVEDSGIGIPKDKYEIIFDKFVKLNKSYDGLYAGTGLGLTIVKKLIETLQGSIEVESELGKGSIFTCKLPVTLPEKYSKKIKRGEISFGYQTPFQILLVEDNKMCQLITSELMKSLGHSVHIVNCSNAALQSLETNQYDLILMNLGLPDVNGNETTVTIRKREAEKRLKPTPIMGISAHVSPEIRSLCINSGMNTVISKPFSHSKLKEMLLLLN